MATFVVKFDKLEHSLKEISRTGRSQVVLNRMRLCGDELIGLSESGWGEFWVSMVSMVIGKAVRVR